MSVQIIDAQAIPGALAGMSVLTPKQITDERGTITEIFRRSTIDGLDIAAMGALAQINVTSGRRGALRGMHGESMTKLLTVVDGTAFGAYVDLRIGSPTFGKVDTLQLEPGVQVLVPDGIANGFQVTSERSLYVYAFDHEWRPDMGGIACNPLDPALAIPWPIAIDLDDPSLISAKDRNAPNFADVQALLERDR